MSRFKFRGRILRSGLIVVGATFVLGASSALAANVQRIGTSPSPSDHASPSTHPSTTPSVHPSDKPKTSPSASASASQAPSNTAPTTPATTPGTKPSGDSHGDCVAKVADNPNAKAANKKGKMTHGAAVRKAAHDCPKGADDGQGDDQQGPGSGGAEKPDPPESPEPAESEAPETGD